ncbi:MAG: sugar ABC transporter permease [Geminicoccaceae bacterium]
MALSSPAALSSASPRGSGGLAGFTHRHFPWLTVFPAVLVILLVGLFPFLYSLVVSFTKVNRRVADYSFHGLINYAKLIADERFWNAALNTGIFTAVALPLELILGLALARLLLNPIPGRQVFIALLILPAVICPVVGGAMWRLMFDNQFGPINHLISMLAGQRVDILWLIDDKPVQVFSAILLCEIWQWTPFMFLIMLAGLGNVDKSLTEAATVDGASDWVIFYRIMLPVIRPVIYVALTIRALDLIRLFDIVYALTRGGPGTLSETISIYAYVTGFEKFDVSYTAAIAIFLIVVLSVVVTVALKRLEIAR